MKIRDSGMPDEPVWESFFDASLVLRRLGFASRTGDVADLGCGYGTFSIPAARLTSGTVHAIDIDPKMLAATDAKARSLGLSNIAVMERDFVVERTGLRDGSIAYAMLFNILHAEDATSLLGEAFRILRPDGVLGVASDAAHRFGWFAHQATSLVVPDRFHVNATCRSARSAG